MGFAVNRVLADYTYSYASKLRPRLDKDDDGRWSKGELESYAGAYEKATGTRLDTGAIFKTYDADGDGYLDAREQAAAYEKDALGLAGLAKAGGQRAKAEAPDKSASLNLADLMASMSPVRKAAFSMAVQTSETKARLLESFSQSGSAPFDFFGMASRQNVASLYRMQMQAATGGSQQYAMANQSLNLLV